MFRKLVLLFVALLSVTLANAQVYADQLIVAGPCTPIVPLTCPTGVVNPQNAVDTDFNSFATLTSSLGVNLIQNTAFLELGFTTPASSGNEIGIVVSNSNKQLNVDVVNALSIKIYDEAGALRQEVNNLGLQNIGLLSGQSQLSVINISTQPSDYKIKKIRIELEGLVSVLNELNVHRAYAAPSCPAILANQVTASQSTTNPNDAVDSDTGTFALLSLPLAITNTAFLEVQFPSPANGGDYVGFEVARNNSILSLGLIENITIYGYDTAGNQLFANSDFNLADLLALDQLGGVLGGVLGVGNGSNSNRSIIGFNTPSDSAYQIAKIRIELAPTIGLLSDLRVYSGFYFSQFKGISITASSKNVVNGNTVTLNAIGGYSNYRWSNGATGQSITVNAGGTYTVMADRAADACSLQGSITIGDNICDANGLVYADGLFASGNCDPIIPLVCPSGVQNPGHAVDNDPSSYALLVSQLGLSLIESTASLELSFSKPGNGGNEIGIVVQSINQTLNADVVDNLTITLLDSTGAVILKRENLGLQNIGLLSGSSDLNIIRISTPPGNYKIARVRIEMTGTANVAQDLAVYGVFYNCSCPPIFANTLVTSTSVDNPNRAIDNDESTFATVNLPLALTNDGVLELAFNTPGVAGDYVGFEIAETNNLLNVGLIENITVIAYDEAGVEVARQADFSLTDLVAADQLSGILGGLLNVSNEGNNKPFVIGFVTPPGTYKIGKIRLEVAPTIGVLSTLNVFNGFYYSQLFGLPVSSSALSTCSGKEVTLTAAPGYINYRWSTGQTGESITVNQPGIYTVTADRASADGCSLQGSITIANGSDLNINTTVTQPNCNTSNGSVVTTVANGSGNYTYNWSNGATTANINNIPAGVYFLTVNDTSNGCSQVKQVNVSDVEGPFYQHYVRHATCGLSDGAIFLALDSTSTVSWLGGQTTAVIRDLAAGFYTAIVTNAAGCKTVETYRVLNRSDLNLSVEVTNATCNLADNGTINLTVGAGSQNLQYEWSNGAITQDITGLPHGVYFVVVTDLTNNCQDIIYTSVNETSSPAITLDSLREETCAGNRDGFIQLSATPANSIYLWSNRTTAALNNNLPPAIHTVQVSTTAGCSSYGIYELVARDPLAAAFSTKNQCGGAANGNIVSTVSGGRMPYTYSWSNGDTSATLQNLVAGAYTLRLTDFNGCVQNFDAAVGKDSSCDGGGGEEEDGDNDDAGTSELLSPNGDGFNDVLKIKILDSGVRNTFKVFNRYSELVYETRNYDSSWDGTYKDTKQALPEGTYFYLLKTEGSKARTYKGFFVIKY